MLGNIVIEVLTNLFQGVVFLGFIFFFFKPDKVNAKDIIAYAGTVFVIFSALNYFTFYNNFAVIESSAVYIIILELYSILFLKGNIA